MSSMALGATDKPLEARRAARLLNALRMLISEFDHAAAATAEYAALRASGMPRIEAAGIIRGRHYAD
jgi:hypothetical protein